MLKSKKTVFAGHLENEMGAAGMDERDAERKKTLEDAEKSKVLLDRSYGK